VFRFIPAEAKNGSDREWKRNMMQSMHTVCCSCLPPRGDLGGRNIGVFATIVPDPR